MAARNTNTPATTEATPATFWGEVTKSKTGNNPCRCIERDPSQDTATEMAFWTGTCPRHTKGEFAQGHDARYKGSLIHAHRMGKGVIITQANEEGRITEGARQARGTAMEWAELRGWGRFLTEGKENAKALAKLEGPKPAAE